MYLSICKKFCVYFREDKEDLGHCFPVKVFEKCEENYINVKKAENISSVLKQLFCKECEFYPEDCDFCSSINPGMPCGGYLYYLSLLEERIITLDELAKLCDACKACLSKKT